MNKFKFNGGWSLNRLRAVSLFSWSVEQIARDTQITARVTEGARGERLFSRKKHYCPQSVVNFYLGLYPFA